MANSVTEWLVESARKLGPTHGPDVGRSLVREAIAAEKFDPYKLNLTQLAAGCFGAAWEGRMRQVSARAEWAAEATEANDLSTFRALIGANIAQVQEDAYRGVTTVADQLVGRWESEGDDPLNELTIPYPAVATDPSRDVAPGTDYPRTGFSPYYVTAPRPDKHGLIAVLTMELVRANRTRMWLDASAEVARKVGIEEVKRKLRLVLGITNNYSRNGTAYSTYLTSGARVNQLDDLDFTAGPAELDRMEQLFNGMVHPITGEPIDVMPTTIFSVRGNRFRIKKALETTEIRQTDANGDVVSVSGNPLDFAGDILTDPRAKQLLIDEGGLSAAEASTWTAMGDFPAAFKWREVEPFHTFEVGPNDEAWPPHFFQDIVYATKARFWGVGYVADPYLVVSAYKADA